MEKLFGKNNREPFIFDFTFAALFITNLYFGAGILKLLFVLQLQPLGE